MVCNIMRILKSSPCKSLLTSFNNTCARDDDVFSRAEDHEQLLHVILPGLPWLPADDLDEFDLAGDTGSCCPGGAPFCRGE